MALWVTGTYFHRLFDVFPYLLFSGTQGTGKTKALDVIDRVAFNAQRMVAATPAAVYRFIEETRGTLTIDEAEQYELPGEYNHQILAVLNSGYKKGGTTMRCAPRTHKVERFSTYSPKALAAIAPLSGTLEARCLVMSMRRSTGEAANRAVTREEYRAMIRGLARFLEGRSEEVIADLEARMKAAADEWDFEQAASLRDQLRAVQRVVERQKIVSSAGADQDVIAFAREEGDACVQVFFIRGGKLLGREYFVLEGAQDEDEREVMAAFLKQFYEEAAYVPPEVLLPEQIEEALVIEQWLKGKRGAKVTLRVPRRGRKRELVALAAENAAETLAALRAQWQADAHKHEQALAELQEALDLPKPPIRIECYDISTTQGTEVVGSMVVFVHAVPRKSEYRRFVVRSVQGQDDYAHLREVLQRRFRRWQMATSGATAEAGRPEAPLQPGVGSRDIPLVGGIEGGGWAKLPDLLIVDGGRGQLGVAVEVLKEFDLLARVPVAALAKQREEIFLPGRARPVLLPRRSQGLFLVQRVRDEAHRFAITHHRTRRRRAGVASQLDSIPGVGPARRKALLKAFGSLDAIRAASVEQLAAVPGIPRTVAQAIKEHL